MSSRTVAIIQARMGSRRLPGKVLQTIAGLSVLGHVVRRVQAVTQIDDLVVATSDALADQQVADVCKNLGVVCIRGSEDDVLERYIKAAEFTGADVIVRITADCPLVSPAVIDNVVAMRVNCKADYVSNTLKRSFPVGLDVECFTRRALEMSVIEATSPVEREHVTPFIYNHPDRFCLVSHEISTDWSWLRWTLDTHEDLRFLTALAALVPLAFDPKTSWQTVAEKVRGVPDLLAHNAAAYAGVTKLDSQVRIL